MTNKIAIEYLKDMLAAAEANLHIPDMAEHAEALDMAIESLQRGLENVNTDSCSEKPNRSDIIYRQEAIDALEAKKDKSAKGDIGCFYNTIIQNDIDALKDLPSAQPTLYGYNIEHLELIARVLQKENVPPERVVEILTDIGRIVAIVGGEFEENLRKEVEQYERLNFKAGCD